MRLAIAVAGACHCVWVGIDKFGGNSPIWSYLSAIFEGGLAGRGSCLPFSGKKSGVSRARKPSWL